MPRPIEVAIFLVNASCSPAVDQTIVFISDAYSNGWRMPKQRPETQFAQWQASSKRATIEEQDHRASEKNPKTPKRVMKYFKDPNIAYTE